MSATLFLSHDVMSHLRPGQGMSSSSCNPTTGFLHARRTARKSLNTPEPHTRSTRDGYRHGCHFLYARRACLFFVRASSVGVSAKGPIRFSIQPIVCPACCRKTGTILFQDGQPMLENRGDIRAGDTPSKLLRSCWFIDTHEDQ